MTRSVELAFSTQADLAIAAATGAAVHFEGVAVGTGVYTAQDGSRIAITPNHLPLIAERIAGVQIRDLHDERVRSTVGAVRDARVEGDDVRFVGEIALQPHATIVRQFPETIAFSVGFPFGREDLAFDEQGIAPLPPDFAIDHLAIVGQGQDPDARLTRLRNQAAAHPNHRGMGHVDTKELDRPRHERDQALQVADKARADLAVTHADLEKTNDRLIRGGLAFAAADDAQLRRLADPYVLGEGILPTAASGAIPEIRRR